MKGNLKKILTFIIGWPLSLLALFFIVKTFSPKLQDLSHNIQHLNISFLAVGVLCFFTYYAIRSLIWHLLLRRMGYTIPVFQTLSLWSLSEVKRYIPGNIWSFVGRSVAFTEKGVTKQGIAKALVLEQEFVFLASILVSVASVPFLAKYLFPFLNVIPLLWLVSICFVIIAGAVFIFLPQATARLPKRLRTIVQHLLPQFPAAQTFQLLFFSCLAFLFFGLGYYFSIAALVPLDPQLVFILSGFFVFSLVVGLVSFLTPTGLGVREGVITIGLGNLIPVSIAGFASLFGRIVLVFSEVLFLLGAYGIARLKKQTQAHFESLVKRQGYRIILAVCILLFSIYFITISFLRYDNFYTGRFDLGNMDQTVWNTVHGRFFQLTDPNGTEVVSRLAFHADYLLAAIAPVYILWEDPRMLLLIQVLVLAGGAIFVYLLAEGVLENKPISLAFACCYLLNPAMQRAVLYDFHAVTLATTFLFGAYYFIYKQRYVMFVLFAILAGITKEEIWVIVALLGLYIAIAEFFKNNITGKQKKRSAKVVVFGLGVFGVSLAIFFDLLWYAIPQAANGQHFALQYFSDGSDSPSSLVKNIILSPGKTIQKVLQQERLDYFRKLLEPIGYLSLFSPLFLIFPGADLALNILSDKGELHQIYYQYTAAITPFLFIAAIYGVKNIRRFRPALPMAVLIGYISVMSIMGAYLFGPLPGAAEPNLAMIVQKQADIDYINSALDAISPEYAVASSNALGSHLSQRKYIFTLPNGIDKADVVAFLFSDRYNTPSQAWHKEAAAKLKKDPRYRVWFEKGDFLVFRKIKK